MKDNCFEIEQIFDKEQVVNIVNKIKEIDEPRWHVRDTFGPGRGLPDATCRYDYTNQIYLDKETIDYLKSYAPDYKDYFLNEVAINRYNVGDYIGPHRDRDMHRKNVVISLQEKGDGLLLDETNKFIKDKIGQGVAITGIGPVHSVPEVKNERYSLIFLYE